MLQQGRLAMEQTKQTLTCRALLTALSLIHSSLIAFAQQSTGVEKGRAIAHPGHLTLVPCDIAGIKGKGRCGSYEVYEDRTRRTGRKIALKIVALPATEPGARRIHLFTFRVAPALLQQEVRLNSPELLPGFGSDVILYLWISVALEDRIRSTALFITLPICKATLAPSFHWTACASVASNLSVMRI